MPKVAEFLMTPDLFVAALQLPRGTELLSIAMQRNGHLRVIVTHDDLLEINDDQQPRICRPTFSRQPCECIGSVQFLGWGQDEKAG